LLFHRSAASDIAAFSQSSDLSTDRSGYLLSFQSITGLLPVLSYSLAASDIAAFAKAVALRPTALVYSLSLHSHHRPVCFSSFFFGFSAQRWAHSQSRPPTATATAVTVANAGGELTV
jgi:hypothetical protein